MIRCRSDRTTRHAFAYVFAGSGRFCNASDPLAVPTEGAGWHDTSLSTEADNRSLVLFDRGDEVQRFNAHASTFSSSRR